MKKALLLCCWLAAGLLHAQSPADAARWKREAGDVTIVRDDWGIAHVHGKTDADAVFGMIYAQCEDDFNRVETNYLVSLGRLAEAEGEDKIWQDLRQRLFLDPADLKKQYAGSPQWLRALMDSWADGFNFYLAQHPHVKPRVLTHWEPWMALSFTEGSIGGDIERINLDALRAFYDPRQPKQSAQLEPATRLAGGAEDEQASGSNGFAIAPSNTRDHHALLLINPHTPFFFRSELQVSSDQGLNAYGAVTWGQLFVYQGFNDRAGWMHTSSGVDAVDEFVDTHECRRSAQDGAATCTPAYRFGDSLRDYARRDIVLSYRTADGLKQRTITAFFDHRGPVIRAEGDHWVSIELMNKPVAALEQSFLRTRARSYAEFRHSLVLYADSSNNTVFADADGNIAYWHGNFIPRRDVRFDYTRPVSGSDPATDWQKLMTVDEIPQLHNPRSGWLENVNNWPWSGAGESSLKKSDFPAYVETGTESARGRHAVRVLSGRHDFTLDSLLQTAFDPYLPWFASTIPVLARAWDTTQDKPTRARLREPVTLLRSWDNKWGYDSRATTLAVYWGENVARVYAHAARDAHQPLEEYVAEQADPKALLDALQTAVDKLASDFGTWQVPWGQVNRFQRLDDEIVTHFDDSAPSIPVPFTASTWGSLASFATRPNTGTKKRYGVVGNSFVAVVEFGPRVRARAVTAGGEGGDPASPHFNDQAQRYATGNFREVYFYPDQLKGHTERTYHPGR